MAKLLSLFRPLNRSSVTKKKNSTTTWKRLQYQRVKGFIGRLQWFHFPISLVITFIAFQHFRRIKKREEQRRYEENPNHIPTPYMASNIEISMYKMLPLRTVSRLWGWINSIHLPVIIRSPILRSYASAFGCNLDEADIEDIKQYKNLGEFFRRSLKPGVRPIDTTHGIVSPSDGTILYFGRAKAGTVEQVKGITYTLPEFLGPQTWSSVHTESDNNADMTEYQKSLLINNNEKQKSDLYHCVIYLAPGDYHRFHSPAEWEITYRRHCPGKLLSVRPTFAQWFPNLFNVNERVIYLGKWMYGFFSMTAVGATNVGSVRVYFDEGLITNRKGRVGKVFNDQKLNPITLSKGDAFGEFNLGSTVVLIFEAPKDMKFNIKSGQKIKYGQLICQFDKQTDLSHNENETKGA